MARKKKHQRADGRFEYKATVGRKIDGTPIRKSFYSTVSLTDAKRQAEEYKQQQAVSDATGTPMTVKCVTFAEWSRKWLKTYKEPFVTLSTYQNTYVNSVENHLIPCFGAANLQDIKPADVQQFFASQTQYSKSMLKKLKNTLSAIFEAAIDNDLIYKNPVKYIKLKSNAQPKERKTLTDAQIKFVKEAAMYKLDPVVFLLETGLRRGELVGLMWSDVDLENATLRVQRSVSLENGRPVIRPPKWNSYRTIPLMPSTVSLLRRQPRHSLYVFPAPIANGHEDPNHFSRRLYNFFCTLPEEYRCSAHELRHSYASQLMRHGVNIYTISKLLGHNDISITASVYVHPDIEHLRKELQENLDDISTTECQNKCK